MKVTTRAVYLCTSKYRKFDRFYSYPTIVGYGVMVNIVDSHLLEVIASQQLRVRFPVSESQFFSFIFFGLGSHPSSQILASTEAIF